jgi:hypothetical protein
MPDYLLLSPWQSLWMVTAKDLGLAELPGPMIR